MMKKIVLVAIASLLPTFATISHAALKAVKIGGDMTFDTSTFPEEIRTKYKKMQEKCSSCHSMARIVHVVETGKTSQGSIFDKEAAKQHCISMLRRRDSDLSKEEVKSSLEVIEYLLDESKK